MEIAASQAPATVSSSSVDDRLLRRDMRLLCWELARMVREHGTGELLDLCESLLRLAERRRDGDPQAAADMEKRLAALDVDHLQQLVRMDGCYLELINLAEDRHRVRRARGSATTRLFLRRGASRSARPSMPCTLPACRRSRCRTLLDQPRHLPRLHGPSHRGQAGHAPPACWAGCGIRWKRSTAATCSAGSARKR